MLHRVSCENVESEQRLQKAETEVSEAEIELICQGSGVCDGVCLLQAQIHAERVICAASNWRDCSSIAG